VVAKIISKYKLPFRAIADLYAYHHANFSDGFLFYTMNILELLSSNSYLTVNKALARKVGLEAAALFADLAGSQLYWNNQKELEYSEWFFRTREQIEEQTTLSSKTQLRCIKILVDAGLVQTKLKGLPAVTHYLIAQQEVTNLFNLISQKVASSYSQTAHLDSPKGSTIKNINNKNINNDNININKEISISENLESVEDVKYYFETSQILELFTEKTKAKYKIPKSKSLLLRYGPYKLIKERLEDGSTLEECIKVIESKYNEWKGTEFMRYLIPETIFRKSNFEKYLTQSQIQIENNLSQTQKPLIDDKGNYANTDEGRELFISNIRKRAAEMFRTEREFRENHFGLPNTNANNDPR
jgi:uncharacterized phage protein (TIGR02220 family)